MPLLTGLLVPLGPLLGLLMPLLIGLFGIRRLAFLGGLLVILLADLPIGAFLGGLLAPPLLGAPRKPGLLVGLFIGLLSPRRLAVPGLLVILLPGLLVGGLRVGLFLPTFLIGLPNPRLPAPLFTGLRVLRPLGDLLRPLLGGLPAIPDFLVGLPLGALATLLALPAWRLDSFGTVFFRVFRHFPVHQGRSTFSTSTSAEVDALMTVAGVFCGISALTSYERPTRGLLSALTLVG
ncbi:hypothetical protein E2C01_044608 [Portunus trituberculatus]|uniref:Uncharacterized protein n=1 Tax=Portunus trituberculatus TaxID=210409 RepID=A0A5B7G2S6_PORTR|nr:hypothetical protein [Portunus trituberculatus]